MPFGVADPSGLQTGRCCHPDPQADRRIPGGLVKKPVCARGDVTKKPSWRHGSSAMGDRYKPLPRGSGFVFTEENFSRAGCAAHFFGPWKRASSTALKLANAGSRRRCARLKSDDGYNHERRSSRHGVPQAGRIGGSRGLPQCQPGCWKYRSYRSKCLPSEAPPRECLMSGRRGHIMGVGHIPRGLEGGRGGVQMPVGRELRVIVEIRVGDCPGRKFNVQVRSTWRIEAAVMPDQIHRGRIGYSLYP